MAEKVSAPRQPAELESVAIRAVGCLEIHDVIVAGPYEMLRPIEPLLSLETYLPGRSICC